MLISVAIPLVGGSEAEEVVQNAWLKAYKSWEKFRGAASPRTWLARIVINEAKMQLRSRKREQLFSDLPEADSGGVLDGRFAADGHWSQPPGDWTVDNPADLLASETLQGCLDRQLAAMPDRQRSVYQMRELSGLTFEDIAELLRLSAGNARVLLHRARLQLFNLVDRYQETGEC